MNDRETWDAEYRDHRAIPSSDRDAPARAVQALEPLLELEDGSTVLDIGCGNGRNTAHFAGQGHDVIARDLSEEALRLARGRIHRDGIADRVDIGQADVLDGLDIDAGSIDLIIDAYVSCHFLDAVDRRRYWDAVTRVLREGGAVLWTGMSVRDGYYRRLSSSHPDREAVIDPLNDVAKRLYGQADLSSMTPERLPAQVTMDLSFADTVDGEQYQRHVLGAIFRYRS
jgi:cyclopropane fatty-acyl-phospholipid synthase-like methyltransferase